MRAALRVVLPEGLHTQSNKPRDPLLIPTVLTIAFVGANLVQYGARIVMDGEPRVDLVAPRTLLVWDAVESAVPQEAVSRIRFAPGARVGMDSPRQASVESDGRELVLHAFGGELTLGILHWRRGDLEKAMQYIDSTINLAYTLRPNQMAIELDVDIDWHEQLKMLKLAFPVAISSPQVTASNRLDAMIHLVDYGLVGG